MKKIKKDSKEKPAQSKSAFPNAGLQRAFQAKFKPPRSFSQKLTSTPRKGLGSRGK